VQGEKGGGYGNRSAVFAKYPKVLYNYRTVAADQMALGMKSPDRGHTALTPADQHRGGMAGVGQNRRQLAGVV
jgi:hypothetical protein